MPSISNDQLVSLIADMSRAHCKDVTMYATKLASAVEMGRSMAHNDPNVIDNLGLSKEAFLGKMITRARGLFGRSAVAPKPALGKTMQQTGLPPVGGSLPTTAAIPPSTAAVSRVSPATSATRSTNVFGTSTGGANQTAVGRIKYSPAESQATRLKTGLALAKKDIPDAPIEAVAPAAKTPTVSPLRLTPIQQKSTGAVNPDDFRKMVASGISPRRAREMSQLSEQMKPEHFRSSLRTKVSYDLAAYLKKMSAEKASECGIYKGSNRAASKKAAKADPYFSKHAIGAVGIGALGLGALGLGAAGFGGYKLHQAHQARQKTQYRRGQGSVQPWTRSQQM